MNIEVEYKNHEGNVANITYPFIRLAFAKHLGIAGQAYAPSP